MIRATKEDYFFGANRQAAEQVVDFFRSVLPGKQEAAYAEAELRFSEFQVGYCVSHRRSDWLELFDLDGKVVADLGCGWGPISVAASKRAKLVFALDATLPRLQFLGEQLRLEGVGNVVPIHCDAFDIPIPNASLDLVFLIGLLEYAGLAKPMLEPEVGQEALLREVRRVLRPDGQLVLGIENRYYGAHFLGHSSHGDLPFVAVVPRVIANAVNLAFRGDKYRTLTHSIRGYANLLKRAGFESVTSFATLPHYQSPIWVFETRFSQGAAARLLRNSLPSTRWERFVLHRIAPFLAASRLLYWLSPAFFVHSRRDRGDGIGSL